MFSNSNIDIYFLFFSFSLVFFFSYKVNALFPVFSNTFPYLSFFLILAKERKKRG